MGVAQTTKKNKRLKTYNYTEKREKLKKVVESEIATGNISNKSTQLAKAGYKALDHKGSRKAIPEMVEEIYPSQERIERIKNLGNERNDDPAYLRLELDTIKELNKIADIYPDIRHTNKNLNVDLNAIANVVDKLDEN